MSPGAQQTAAPLISTLVLRKYLPVALQMEEDYQRKREMEHKPARDEWVWQGMQAQQQQQQQQMPWGTQQDMLMSQQMTNPQSQAMGLWDRQLYGSVEHGSGGVYNREYPSYYAPLQHNRLSSSPAWADTSLSMDSGVAYLFNVGYNNGFVDPLSQHLLSSSPEDYSSSAQDNTLPPRQQFYPQQSVQDRSYHSFEQHLVQPYGFSYNQTVAPTQYLYPAISNEAAPQSGDQTFTHPHVGQVMNVPNGYVQHHQPPNGTLPHNMSVVANGATHVANDLAPRRLRRVAKAKAPTASQPSSQVVKVEADGQRNPFVKPHIPPEGQIIYGQSSQRSLQHVPAKEKNARVIDWLKTRPLSDIQIRTRKRESSSPSPCERTKRIKEEASSPTTV
ncbi:hypothetical protein P280DRAFT_518059 [Massarina eburnea CBS 473.64]|uniref:Uncharacterized protein n=1 Tax=Massarina eburnea CBS 473.64 TaxID=1395130 RepID=A0A6A6S1Z9_9PLEO|nr:hypothetical protein P280DRAFT_518059 [Massarina eburnea CBS 473.64]